MLKLPKAKLTQNFVIYCFLMTNIFIDRGMSAKTAIVVKTCC